MQNRIKAKDIPAIKAKLLKQQSGRCALCREKPEEPKDICLDHSYQTGFVRAVLCRNCNSIEGRIRHYANRAKRNSTVEVWVKRLIQYWEYHSNNPSGIYHPSYRTEEEKRIRRNKKARKRRKLKNEENSVDAGKVRVRKRERL